MGLVVGLIFLLTIAVVVGAVVYPLLPGDDNTVDRTFWASDNPGAASLLGLGVLALLWIVIRFLSAFF